MGSEPGTDRTPRTARRWLIVAAVTFVILLALAVALDFATASPRLCASCHEMTPRYTTWTQSPHAEVACVKCHQAPTPWHALPQRLVGRAQLLTRDVTAHVKGQYKDPVDSKVPGTNPVPDAVCLQCHDVNRKATSGFRIIIDHPKHAKRNGSCVSCHVRTAHPVETRGKAISLMAQCYTCHGNPATPKASADCRLCHPADYQLLPKSHEAKTWKKADHGKLWRADKQQCGLCHKKEFCSDCHGVEMPHPKGWAQGATGHAATAQLNRAVCTRCHDTKPDMCAMCHHKEWDPSKGTWLTQHFITARDTGAGKCLECHSPLFCSGCHVRGGRAVPTR
jgi:nitrate/TMAO reductase-like tetraheme cytochrome c subunit